MYRNAAIDGQAAPTGAPQPGALGVFGPIAVIAGATLLAFVFSFALDFGVEVLALAVGGILGVLVGVLAITHFDWFIMFLLVVRTSLDLLAQGGVGGGAFDPAAAVGAVFVATSSLWLAMRYLTGDWVKPSPPTKALYALAGAAIASVITSDFPVASLEACARLIAGVLMFAVLEQILGRRRDVVPWLIVLLGSSVLPIVMGYYQLVTGAGLGQAGGTARVIGTFVHPNPYASYLISVILMSAVVAMRSHGRLRRAAMVVVVAALPLVGFTYTRIAWIALIAGILYLGAKLDYRLVLGIVAMGILAVAASPSILARITDVTDPTEIYNGAPSNSMEWRLQYWQELLPLNGDSPLTGIGLEVTQRVTDAELQPHNTFIQVYVEMGLLGASAVIAVVVTFVAYLRRRLASARTPSERYVAIGSIAVALAVIFQAPSENLLTFTIGYWYMALAMLYGFGSTNAGTLDAPAADPPRWRLRPKEPAGSP